MSGPIWSDTHCHLERSRFGEDLPGVVARAREAGVGPLIAIGAAGSQDACREAVALARTDASIWCAIGFHPHEAAQVAEVDLDSLNALGTDERVVGIGETGLDYFYDLSPRDAQRRVFERQIAIARTLSKPLVIHTRGADDETLDVLVSCSARDVGGVVHCCTSEWPFVRAALDLGFCIGVTGIVSFKNGENVRELVRRAPLDRIVLETDSPFLAPVPHRGRRNEPALVVDVGAAVSRVLGFSSDEIATRTTENARRLFRLLG